MVLLASIHLAVAHERRQLCVHTAACGGAYQLAVQGFGGLGFESGRLTIDPALPDDWESLSYPIRWRDLSFRVTVEREQVKIAADPENDRQVEFQVRGSVTAVSPGTAVTA